MSLVGMGRAFNLRFMPNGPLRTNCYHRPMPQIGMFGGGSNMSYTENINIQQGPTGFWGFMTGLTQGLFGGGMFGCGLFDMIGMLRSPKTPQGAGDTHNGDNKLFQLRNLFKAKNVNIEETGKVKFTVTDSKGNMVGKPNMTFDETIDELNNLNKAEPKVETTKVKEKAPEVEEKKDNNDNEQVQDTGDRLKSSELKNDVSITVVDEVWDAAHPNKDGHITGETKLSGQTNSEGFDKLITIGGKRYQLQDKKVDGDPVYKSLDGDGDTYRLSKKSGQLVLIQSESDKGKLSGVGTTDIHPRHS